MPVVIVLYAAAIGTLIVFGVRSFLNMQKKDSNELLYRQYFFVVLILLFLLLVSGIVILLHSTAVTVLGGGGSGITERSAIQAGYGFLVYIIFIILIIVAIVFFDWYILKRTAKNEQEYALRRRFLFGALLGILGISALLMIK